MKNALLASLILTLAFAATRMAAAQDAPETQAEAPAKPEPAAEAPAPKTEPKPAPKTEAPAKVEPEPEAPAPKPAPKPEAPAAKAEPAKELNPGAKIFVPLADNYKKASDELQAWILHIDAEISGVSGRISRIQADIEKNEAAITKLKLDGDRSGEGKNLAKTNKELWADLSAARKERADLSKGFAREAIQRAKSYQLEIIEKLEAIKAQAK